MPVLDLQADSLTDPHMQWVVRMYIGSIMLWPDDPAHQKQQEKKRLIWRAHAYMERIGEVPDSALIPANYVSDLYKMARHGTAKNLYDLKEYEKGVVSGQVLCELLYLSETDPERASIETVSEKFRRPFSTSGNIKTNIWPKYRSVSPFWAAHWEYLHNVSAHKKGPLLADFPCPDNVLVYFLRTAEKYRIWAEEKHLNNRKRMTLLDPDETWSLPPKMKSCIA